MIGRETKREIEIEIEREREKERERMIGILGHNFALIRLYWAGDNLSERERETDKEREREREREM